jgi:hypothetical protein
MLSSDNVEQHFLLNHREVKCSSAVASGVVVALVFDVAQCQM